MKLFFVQPKIPMNRDVIDIGAIDLDTGFTDGFSIAINELKTCKSPTDFCKLFNDKLGPIKERLSQIDPQRGWK